MNIQRLKKMMCFVLVLSVVLSNVFIVHAQETKKNNAEEKIKDTIEAYIEIYENQDMDYKNAEKQKEALQEFYTERKSSVKCKEKIDFLIDRRTIIYENSTIDLNEYNKTIKYDYTDIVVKGESANVNVIVEKIWNYTSGYYGL